MLHVTPNAAAQIKAMLAEKKPPLTHGGLRIAIEDGGCSGRQYNLAFDSRKEGDRVFHEHDVDVFIDSVSLALIDDSTIDYTDELTDRGFKIHIPKAKQTCGCGTSFDT